MKLSGFLGIILLISAIAHGLSVREIKNLYDANVVLTSQNEKLEADTKTLATVNSATITETRATYRAQNSALKLKLDSLEMVNEIKPDEVVQATVVETSFADSTAVQADVGKPEVPAEPGEVLKLPVSFNSECWSMKGVIQTTDPVAQLLITDRKANNSVQLLVLKPKKFLGFLWRTKQEQFKIFSDCGEATISGVNFIDQ